ncbi:MAG: flavin reductase family protein [Candidatus Altiarchaeota archaeon]
MEVKPENFYKILAPRITALITTIDSKDRINAAPFSFIMPISFQPPFLTFSCGHGKDTLLNVRETKEFVVNLPSEEILEKVLRCSERFPRGVSELERVGLTAEKAKKIKPPRVKECFAWLECKFEFEKEFGDHVLIVGKVLCAEVKDNFLDVKKAKLPLHITGREFAIANRAVKV